MKKYKVLILLLIVFVLTGCQGSYNIKLNEDLSVSEDAKIVLKNSDGLYEKALNLLKEEKIDEDSYTISQTEDTLKLTYNKEYISFEDYILNSKIYKQLFNEILYEKTSNNLTIETESKFKFNSNKEDNIINDYDISLMQINFETPFKVTSDNSDENYNGRYTWNLNSNTTNKKIKMSINTVNSDINKRQIIVLLVIGLIAVISLIVVSIRYIRSKRV